MANKIVVLRAGEFEQVCSPMHLYKHSATAFVAGFNIAANAITGLLRDYGDKSR